MPTTTGIQGIPLPEPTDADNVPLDLANLANYVETRLVMRFANKAQRDSVIQSPTPGMVATTLDNCVTWVWRVLGAWSGWWPLPGAQFANAAERDAAIPSPAPGMQALLLDKNVVWIYAKGTSWSGWVPPPGTPVASYITVSGAQTIPNNAYTPVYLGYESYRLYGTLSADHYDFIPGIPGLYLLSGKATFFGSSVGARMVMVGTSGTYASGLPGTMSGGLPFSGAGGNSWATNPMYTRLDTTTSVSLIVWQSSGAGLGVAFQNNFYSPGLTVTYGGLV